MDKDFPINEYIQQYIFASMRLIDGDYATDIPVAPSGKTRQLGLTLQELAQTLEKHNLELQQLGQIISLINAGLLLDEILEKVYEGFFGIIPYNRIGFSLIQDDGKIVRSRWLKTDQPKVHLKRGYAAPLKNSSLQTIIASGQPRIISDLVHYLQDKPDSKSTRLIVAEGIRSSLTCPLIINGSPVGFMFFSSTQPDTYHRSHVDIFQKIAGQLSMIVEKGRLVSEIADQKEAIESQHKELRKIYLQQEDYLQQVARVTQAAVEVEEGRFSLESLDEVAGRTDKLGQLARVFQHMSREVYAREQGLKQQLEKLRIEIDESRRVQQVQEITGSDSFQDLRQRVRKLRSKSKSNAEE